MGIMEGTAMELSKKVAQAQEQELMGQLNWLVSRGLLVIEKSYPRLTFDESRNQIEWKQLIELKLKDHEYVESLENENKSLKETIDQLRGILKARFS